MVISQGDVFWADLRKPLGSEPGFRRPVVVVQSDALNRSLIGTAMCVPLTSNMRWVSAPGNTALDAKDTGLPRSSVALAAQILTLDRDQLQEHVGRLSDAKLRLILDGIGIVLDM